MGNPASHPKKFNLAASTVALLFVLAVSGGAFWWWFVNRPSYILYQLNSSLGKGSEAAAITEYERLLSRKNLSKEEEIRVRTALGEFYWKAGSQQGTVFFSNLSEPTYEVGRPFLDKAKNEFNRILELDPNNSAAHMYKGLMHLVQGTDVYAQQELDLSRKLDPRSPWPMYYLSLINRERGNPAKAREFALEALAVKPDFDEARIALVTAYSDLGEMEKANKEFNRLSDEFKANPQIHGEFALILAKQNYWEAAAREMDLALKAGATDGWVKIDYGLVLLEKGLFDEASGEFSQASNLMPKSAWPVVWLAKSLFLRRNCADAGRIAQLLNDALPRWPYTHMVRGWTYLCEGKDSLAVSAFSEVLRLAPDFSEAALNLADIYLDRGQFDQAGSVLRPLLDKKISEAEAYSLLTRSFYLQGEWALARETAECALKASDRIPWPYVWLGLLEAERGNYANGETALRRALNLGDNPLAKGYFGWFKARAGDPAKGEELIQDAIARRSESAELWLLKGQVYLLEKSNLDAVQSFKRAIEIKPYLIWGHLGLVKAYAADGSMDLAKESLRVARRINPQNKEVVAWGRKLKIS